MAANIPPRRDSKPDEKIPADEKKPVDEKRPVDENSHPLAPGAEDIPIDSDSEMPDEKPDE